MRPPRGLSEAEEALWSRLVQTVKPLAHDRPVARSAPVPPRPPVAPPAPAKPSSRSEPPSAIPVGRPSSPPPTPRPLAPQGLDSHWERRLRNASIAPDFTLDLHGHTLDQAYRRLDNGLAQARAAGARLVLVITGRPRPAEAADRAARRGAIRAKFLDWLAAGRHADAIAAIRPAHARRGGEGALYIVLKRHR